MKPDLNRCLRLLDDGFSLLTVGEGKQPNIKWKELQNKALSKDSFENFYNLETSNNVGIITGYHNIEAIDIDLKVLNTLEEKKAFWNEYISFLSDNIEDFKDKFIIVKTQNGGFHIIYKCEKIAGNVKIATPKSSEKKTEALIESRGVGGYIFVYDQFIQGNGYSDIKTISVEDREILWTISKTYNYVQEIETTEKKYKEIESVHHGTDLKIWDDFNNRHTVWDLVCSEFDIVRKLADKTIIRRNGAKSPHSGYIFENSKCMFLFSTGTQYPNEKLLNAFHVYAIQKHHGNFSDAAKELYKQGYGSRVKKKLQIDNIAPIPELKIDSFPIDIFPDNIQIYISEVQRTLNASIDYLGSSFLWVLSLCIGNSIKIQVKQGWYESAVIWVAIVGKAGIGKTHNIEAMTRPLQFLNDREIKNYAAEMVKFEAYTEMSKKEKALAEEIKKPGKTQFIVGDITIESFFDQHQENLNGIGILRDELSGWIKDLNKYRPGSDLETYLSCWSNQSIILNRKTAKSAYIPRAFVPIIGGVQPSILSLHYTPENKDNGFIDRILLCYPELEVEKYCDAEISQDLITWYNDYIIALFEVVRSKLMVMENGSIEPNIIRFNQESKKEWIRIFNKITDLQNSENENEYMKSILPKQKSYVCRFALLLNVLYSYDDGSDLFIVSKKAILGAEKLSDYYIKMAAKNKFEAVEQKEIIDIIKHSGKITAKDQFEALFVSDPKLNRTKVANQLNVSRRTINYWVDEIRKCAK